MTSQSYVPWDFSQYCLHLANHFNRVPTWSALNTSITASQFYACGDRHRAVGGSKNPEREGGGGSSNMGGITCPPPSCWDKVTSDQPKCGGALATPAPLTPTGLQACRGSRSFQKNIISQVYLKFISSEKATKFCEISTNYLTSST